MARSRTRRSQSEWRIEQVSKTPRARYDVFHHDHLIRSEVSSSEARAATGHDVDVEFVAPDGYVAFMGIDEALEYGI